MLHSTNIAELLIDQGCIRFSFDPLFEFSSGIRSPFYCDCRKLLEKPMPRQRINLALLRCLRERQNLNFYAENGICYVGIENSSTAAEPEVIVGTATAGIPWATLSAHELQKPLSYVRPNPKKHGTKSTSEGASLKGRTLVVIEDVVSTASSTLAVVEQCRKEGGLVAGIFSLFTYNFNPLHQLLKERNCSLISLTSFKVVISVALTRKLITQKELIELCSWHESISSFF